jgi:hypothetical protein
MKSFVSSDGRTALSVFTAAAEAWSATVMTIASGAGSDTYARHASWVFLTETEVAPLV